MPATVTSRARARMLVLVAALLILTGPLLWRSAQPVAAAPTTFVVNSDADHGADGCEEPPGDCTLREVILGANGNPGADTIEFNIPGGGVRSIRLSSELPDLLDSVTIDGYTQPGAKKNTAKKGTNARLRIELDGSTAGASASGLTVRVDGSGSSIHGLVINRFSLRGIQISSSSNNRIEGNFVGTDPGGTIDLGNGSVGVGVFVTSALNTIGGSSLAARNLISGNDGFGIEFGGPGNRAIGNLIGTERDGVSLLSNGSQGVEVGTSDNLIAKNSIAHSVGSGVRILAADTGNRITRNAIFANGGKGIDLSAGANNDQAAPQLTSAKTRKKKNERKQQTTIKGELQSAPNTDFTIEFFANPPGGDEGKKFIGKKKIRTDGSGDDTFTFKPKRKVGKGKTITATATDEDGNTSEFSAPRVVK